MVYGAGRQAGRQMAGWGEGKPSRGEGIAVAAKATAEKKNRKSKSPLYKMEFANKYRLVRVFDRQAAYPPCQAAKLLIREQQRCSSVFVAHKTTHSTTGKVRGGGGNGPKTEIPRAAGWAFPTHSEVVAVTNGGSVCSKEL